MIGEKLEGHGAGAGDHVRVVERMDEFPAVLADELLAAGHRLAEGLAVQLDGGAEQPCAGGP